ncbi:anti sigma factor C-terminal domain-containing protein [Clostridium sp. YIM B02555]|uniref:anti sigma factor C-terminal domain-containing protein n=1 Tax=Clostridium sp. YIM B02555 TaxID=2911968 RepID=UPI001EEE4DB3|nr:anti sigma factor C-terminal domain-containing protein [Clostridium sp. YIM B02555]
MSKEIDDIFSDNMEDEIKNEVRKKRNKLNLKLIIIAIISTLAIVIGGSILLEFESDKYIETSYAKDKKMQELEYIVRYPNEYIGKESCREIGYFKYESTYDISKRIGGRVIFAGSSTDSSSGLGNKGFYNKESHIISNIPLSQDINKRDSNAYGLRELHFFYPYVHYGKDIYNYETDKNKVTEDELKTGKENIINDFHFLNEIEDNKIVEMGLSFDKQYTYEEVNKMLDSNLITFYWVDNNSEEEKKHIIEYVNPAFDVVGIKSMDMAGEYHDNVDERMLHFKDAINQLRNLGDTEYINNIDENNIKIIGAVVVGSSKELKAIQNNPMIKHAVLGTVVDKY